VTGLLQTAADTAQADPAAEAAAQARLQSLVAARRAAGAPLPPGACGVE
jgi:hypothetical protein